MNVYNCLKENVVVFLGGLHLIKLYILQRKASTDKFQAQLSCKSSYYILNKIYAIFISMGMKRIFKYISLNSCISKHGLSYQ